MVDESVVKIVRQYLQTLVESGFNACYGIVFGSQVKGDHHPWSDIDLLVISPCFDGEHKRKDVNLLWRIAARVDSRIEPIAVGQHQFEEDTSSTIIEIARREGQAIRLI